MKMSDAREFSLRHSVNQCEEDKLLMAGRGTKSRFLIYTYSHVFGFTFKQINLHVCDHGNDVLTKIRPAKLRTIPNIIVVFRSNRNITRDD
jgi:hypothetical protein